MEDINLLRKIAWTFHQSTGLDWDDLFQEAYLAYRYAIDHYDTNKKVKLSVFIWIHVTNQLRTYHKDELNFTYPLRMAYSRERYANINLAAWVPSEEKYYDHHFELEELSEDAQKIAEIVLATAKKFLSLSYPEVCERLENILTRRGWSKERVQEGIHNLKLACS
jgi:DNA-directed RNA polymerase specialized sigma subunit